MRVDDIIVGLTLQSTARRCAGCSTALLPPRELLQRGDPHR